MRLNATYFVIGCLLLVPAISGLESSFADLPYGEPSVNRDIPNPVPYELVQKIALVKAAQKWGPVAPGPVLPCCDDNGDLVAYMFVFAIGVAECPNAEAIRASVLEGRRMAEEGLAAMSEPEQKALIDAAAKGASNSSAEGNAAGPIANEAVKSAADARAKRIGEQKSIGAGEFGTVVVSAREDRFPVPVYMHHLPPYFFKGDLAAKCAATALGVSESAAGRQEAASAVRVARVYFFGRARGQYFEFGANNRTVLVDAQHLEVAAPEKVLFRNGQKASEDPERAAAIAEAWAAVKTEVR